MSKLLVGTLGGVLVFSSCSAAGLHLGMKSACRCYGEAWDSGSKEALRGATTADFYQQIARIPADAFARLPRGGIRHVVGSSKGRGIGHVHIASSRGPVTLVLVGGGFDWRVADVYKPGDDGRSVSLKSYLDASLTAAEFARALEQGAQMDLHPSASAELRAAFAGVSLNAHGPRIDLFSPDRPRAKPYVLLGKSTATVRFALPGGESDWVEFRMVRQPTWKVDDFSLQTQRIVVPSFAAALPLIQSVLLLQQYVRSPQEHDPSVFLVEGELRGLLEGSGRSLLAASPEPWTKVAFADDLRSARIDYPHRTVHVTFGDGHEVGRIRSLAVEVGGARFDLASLLKLRDGVASSFLQLRRLRTAVATDAPTPAATPSWFPAILQTTRGGPVTSSDQ